MEASKKKYFFKKALPNMSKEQIKDYLEYQVFETELFQDHVLQVSLNLNVDECVVRDILKHYFIMVMYICNTKRKFLTKINLYGFCSLFVEKGNRV